jgi:hypothetical protein
MRKKNPMPKKFAKGLDKAWFQYQDLYDRYMALLREIGEATNLEDIQSKYEAQIEDALNEWSTPQERFEMGGYDDFDLGLDEDYDENS